MQFAVTTTVGRDCWQMLKNFQNIVFLLQTNIICMQPMKTVLTRTFAHALNNYPVNQYLRMKEIIFGQLLEYSSTRFYLVDHQFSISKFRGFFWKI